MVSNPTELKAAAVFRRRWLPHGVAGALGAALVVMVVMYVRAIGERDQKIAELIDKAKVSKESMTAELEGTRTLLGTTREELKKATADLVEARAEITKLKVTPRYFFDQALEVAKDAGDDAGDAEAAKAFRMVVDRFPESELAKVADERAKELRDRIEGRAKKRKAAQAEVRNLIKKCRENTAAATRAHSDKIWFNEHNELDMNTVIAGNRQASVFEQNAAQAKEKAGKLLKGDVPDVDGELAKLVEGCDGDG